jgi:hypothetical protein
MGLGVATATGHGAINKKIARYGKMKRQAQKAGNQDSVRYWDELINKARQAHQTRESGRAMAYSATQYAGAAAAIANIAFKALGGHGGPSIFADRTTGVPSRPALTEAGRRELRGLIAELRAAWGSH